MPEILAYFLLVLLCIGAGVCGAAVWTWGLRRTVTDCQLRIEDLEERTLSEIRKRVGAVGREKIAAEKNLEIWAQEQKTAPATAKTPVLKPLMEWRKDKMTGAS